MYLQHHLHYAIMIMVAESSKWSNVEATNATNNDGEAPPGSRKYSTQSLQEICVISRVLAKFLLLVCGFVDILVITISLTIGIGILWMTPGPHLLAASISAI